MWDARPVDVMLIFFEKYIATDVHITITTYEYHYYIVYTIGLNEVFELNL